ncbi:SRPBCC domain-containing protein [Saccharomonospora sp. NPDC046836]|uniref:SRPBCC family protein n=1 Tax=Saccharomonospora sp. NPDC046836 TaxID=3156921 RepID=UPI0033EAB350
MEVKATRVFDATVEQVWQAWTESRYVHQWWGPDGFTAPVAEMEVHEGGRSRVSMRSPDGAELYNTWTYERVIPLQRLEFIMGFADVDWQPRTPAELGLPPDIPARVRHVVTFTSTGQKTELTVTELGYTSPQTVEISKLGLEQCLDKMAIALSVA